MGACVPYSHRSQQCSQSLYCTQCNADESLCPGVAPPLLSRSLLLRTCALPLSVIHCSRLSDAGRILRTHLHHPPPLLQHCSREEIIRRPLPEAPERRGEHRVELIEGNGAYRRNLCADPIEGRWTLSPSSSPSSSSLCWTI